MTSTEQEEGKSYPVFRGLQSPLEFMGLQGRYIYWAAAAIGIALIGFIIAYIINGFLTGMLTALPILGVGAIVILLRQQRGLHSKKIHKGMYVYIHVFNL